MRYSHIEIALISINMHKYGGRFIRALGNLVSVADDEDKNTIIEAFPKYFDDYHNYKKN